MKVSRVVWFNLILLFALIQYGFSQINNENKLDWPFLKGSYIGQKPPGKTPEIFAPGIITTDNHEHSRIEFSRDGHMIFWSVVPVNHKLKFGQSGFYKGEEQKIFLKKLKRLQKKNIGL